MRWDANGKAFVVAALLAASLAGCTRPQTTRAVLGVTGTLLCVMGAIATAAAEAAATSADEPIIYESD